MTVNSLEVAILEKSRVQCSLKTLLFLLAFGLCMFSSNKIFADVAAENKSSVIIYCSSKCDCKDKTCACAINEITQEKINGHGPAIIKEQKQASLVDAQFLGAQSQSMYASHTHLFILDSTSTDEDTVGVGYINVFYHMQPDSSYYYALDCQKDPIYDYHEWLQVIQKYVITECDGIILEKTPCNDKFIDSRTDLKLNTSYNWNAASVFVIDTITSSGDTLGRAFWNVPVEYDLIDENGVSYNKYEFCNQDTIQTSYSDWVATCRRLARLRFKEAPVTAATAMNAVIAPNPTNGSATFSMDIPETSNLRVVLVDVNGNEVLELHNTQTNAGAFSKTFSTSNIAKGSYFIKWEINEETITIPFIVTE